MVTRSSLPLLLPKMPSAESDTHERFEAERLYSLSTCQSSNQGNMLSDKRHRSN